MMKISVFFRVLYFVKVADYIFLILTKVNYILDQAHLVYEIMYNKKKRDIAWHKLVYITFDGKSEVECIFNNHVFPQ